MQGELGTDLVHSQPRPRALHARALILGEAGLSRSSCHAYSRELRVSLLMRLASYGSGEANFQHRHERETERREQSEAINGTAQCVINCPRHRGARLTRGSREWHGY